jgi:glycosyltransferase involved in cell wall biosynthesis
MLNIALFSECYHPMRNGVVVSVSSFARVLAELGHNVTIFTVRHPDQRGPEEGVVRFPSITLPIRVRYPLAIPIATGEARRLLADGDFDVVHSHSPMLMGHAAIAYARRRRLPLIFTYHTLIEEYTHYVPLPQRWLKRRAVHVSRYYCNTADHVIAPTRGVAERLRGYQVTKPISVIPTGIDIDVFDLVPDLDMRARHDIPADARVLVYAGRIAKEKNIPRILTAFREVLRQEPDTFLLLLGGGPFEPEIRAMVEQVGIGHRTRVTGFVAREQIVQGLRCGDIFVFASSTETQGLVLGEAMACSIPVVAVSADAPRELMDNGVEGLLVPDADGPFADACVTLLRDAEMRQTCGRHARLRAESISAYRCTEALLKIYEEEIDLRTHFRNSVLSR